MPSKNRVKNYTENGYYHIFNRGVEKRTIFHDRADYNKFIDLLRLYLTPVDTLHHESSLLRKYIVRNNIADEVSLLAYCLMPNHFHLLLAQKKKDSITRLMRQVLTGYSMYFNKRYERVGPLFSGVFRGCQVENDDYLLHLSRYIHLNPLDRGASLSEFEWSSYFDYLGKRQDPWVSPGVILKYFNRDNPKMSYQNFVEEYQARIELPTSLLLETN